MTAPHRVLFCQEYFDKRWALQYQQFQKHKWKGAHDIQQDVCFVRPYQSKTGKQEVNIYHKCNTCGLPVQRNRIPAVICPQFSGRPTALKKRKLLCGRCRQEATRALSKKADGSTATGRGHRGERIREASHPGPESIRVLTYNINSIQKHLDEVLRVANEQAAQLVCIQESRLSYNSIPSFCNTCHRKGPGWQRVAIPVSMAATHGGVLVLSREPLALTQVLAHSSSWGRILVCEVLGCRIPFSIFCGYRNSSRMVEEASTALAETFTKVQIVQHKHCIACLDWNMPQGSNALTDIMSLVGGRYLCRKSPTMTDP